MDGTDESQPVASHAKHAQELQKPMKARKDGTVQFPYLDTWKVFMECKLAGGYLPGEGL
jgi:hypothetical protein